MTMQEHIHVFEDLGAKRADGTTMTFREFILETFFRMQGKPVPAIPVGPLPQYPARINWGRWLVDCPNCNSALDVTPTDTIGLCLDCGTEWFEVVFPPPGLKVAVETILLRRPGNRAKIFPHSNWSPGETVAQLQLENLEHGLEI